MDVPTDWFWEGNVVDALARHLTAKGYQIEKKANTHLKERGVDIQALRAGKRLLVEVKRFPPRKYRDPRRAHEHKPTSPTNQAQQWYSHALLAGMRLQTKNPDATIALAFPDFPRYQKLFEETQAGLERLGIGILMIQESGSVHEWGLTG
jgi:hypothetical protein